MGRICAKARRRHNGVYTWARSDVEPGQLAAYRVSVGGRALHLQARVGVKRASRAASRHLAAQQVDVLVHIQVLQPLGVTRQLHQQAAIADVHLRARRRVRGEVGGRGGQRREALPTAAAVARHHKPGKLRTRCRRPRCPWPLTSALSCPLVELSLNLKTCTKAWAGRARQVGQVGQAAGQERGA